MTVANTIIRSVFIVALGAGLVRGAVDQKLTLTIQSPTSGETVPMRTEVIGKSDPKATVWIIVLAREPGECWVQGQTMADSNGNWRFMAQFGEAQHSSKPYELRALLNPKQKVAVGKTTCWPLAELHSDPVYVTRK